MKDEDKTKEELLSDLLDLRRKYSELEAFVLHAKETEKRLKESEERLELALRGADLGLWDYNLQTGEAVHNERAVQMVGYSLDELEPHLSSWGSWVHPEDMDRVIKAFEAHVKGEAPLYECEHRLRCKSGEYIWVLARAKLVERDAAGNPVRLAGTSLDVTERKRAEEALRESQAELEEKIEERTELLRKANEELRTEIGERERIETELRSNEERYRSLVENLNDVVYSVDAQGEITFISPAIERFTRHKIAELIGRPFQEFVHPEDVPGLIKRYQAIREGHMALHEYRLLDKDGREIPIRSYSRPVYEDGRFVGLTGLISDISDRKRAEQALRESELKYRVLSENIPCVVYSALPDEHCTNLFVSGRIEELTDYSVEEFLEDPALWPRIIHPDDRSNVWEKIEEHRRQRSVLDVAYRIITRAGTVKWIRDRANPTLDENGEMASISGFMEDITERKRAEKELVKERNFSTFILDSLPGTFYLFDDQGKIMRWNTFLERASGYSSDEIASMSVLDFFPKDEKAKLQAAVHEVFTRSETYVEAEWLTRGGDRIPYYFSARQVRVEDRPCLIGVGIDVTDRKRIERALEESEEKYRHIFENAVEGIYQSSPEGRFITVNPALARMFGYGSPEEMLREVTDMAHQLYAKPEHRETFKRGLADPGHLEGYEVECRRKDGTRMWVSVNARSVRDESGRTLYYEGTTEDITDRKATEEALRKSEALLREAQRVAHIGHWEVDSPIGTSGWSEEIFHIFGLDPARGEPSLAAHRDIIHPEDWELLRGSVIEASDHGTPFSIQFRVIRPDESMRWVEARGYPAGNAEGQPFRLFGTAQDITDLKKTEEQLRKSREMLELALAGADLGLWDWNVQTGNAVVDQRSADIIGYSLDEIDPRLEFLLRIMHPDDRSRVTDLLNSSLRGQTDVFEAEYRLQAKSGEWKWVLSRGKVMERAENGNSLRMTGTFMDVTNRKRAEEALRESEVQKQAILDGITTNIAFVNEDLEIKWVNKTAADSVGKLPSQMIGHRCHEFWADPDKPCEGCPTVMAFGTLNSHHVEVATPDGRVWDERGEPIFNAQGQLIGVVEIAHDITERKKADQERESLKAQLFQSQKMEAIGTLAGGIAHDFNNLLTVVMGFSELLLTEKDQERPEYEDLQKILHAARNGADLVQRLLMFSRKSESKPVPMNLNKQIVQIEKLLRHTIPRMVDINLDLSADLPEISADSSQIEQVLMNLAVNARDAMPDVGKLTVRTSVVALDQEYCSFHVEASPGEHVVLEVSDTGYGMDKETVEHIFEPFFTTKEMGRGTGLGLAMVYGIVKHHNGHITVYSEVGKGATFRLYFPTIVADEEPQVEDSDLMPDIGTETVLLVDDEQLVRELGARILSKHGYDVLQAENGRKALDLFKKERPRIALVVLDLIMPEMGGMECLKELLRIDPQVNVLIASGYSADASIKETIEMGAKGFVSKPFRVKELLRDVRRVLDEG